MKRNVGVVERGIDATLSTLERSCSQDPRNVYVHLLRQCANAKAYLDGKKVHDHLIKHGYSKNCLLSNCLIHMYGRCGNVQDARNVFDSSATRNEHSWSAMITAYAKNGRRREALELYRRSEIKGSNMIYISALGACGGPDDLAEGRGIHRALVSAGLGAESDTVLATSLFSMYAKCGSLEEARKIFDKMPGKDVVCYTIMISAYAQEGQYEGAIELYKEMDARGIPPNDKAFACILSACSGLKNMELGKAVHKRIIDENVPLDVVLQNAILNMYAKCGDLEESIRLFEKMSRRTVATWNAVITAYVHHKLFPEALEAYHKMDTYPNAITFTSVLSACCSPADLEQGKAIHDRILASGVPLQTDEILQNALVTMYGRCGSIEDAERMFRSIRRKNVFSYTTMITAYSQQGYERDAIELFRNMEREGRVEPDPVTYVGAITACTNLGDLEEGMRMHALIEAKGIESSVISTALIDLYGKWGSFEDVLRCFQPIEDKDTIAWTAMIAACVHHNQHALALEMFSRMEQDGLHPNNVTYSLVFTACSYLGNLRRGKDIESRIEALGIQCDDVLESGRLCLYVRCAGLSSAREVFDKVVHRSVMLWTTMIAAYNQEGRFAEALELYHAMADVEPDSVTFLNVLTAISSLRVLEQGKAVHERLSGFSELDRDPALRTALVHMYVRCGELSEAKRLFDEFQEKDVVAWTSMISSYNQERHSDEAIRLYFRMNLDGVEPNSVTYCSVLSSCSSLGSLALGREVHARATATGHTSNYLVKNALVHMYSKCDRLDIAREVFDTIEPKAYPSWRIMLSAYASHGYATETLEFFSRMNFEGFKLGSPVFSAALMACTAMENAKRGRELHHLIRASGLRPDLVLQNIAMNMYAKCGDLEAARSVFDEIQERNHVSWSTMIGAYAQNGLPEEALQLYKAMDVEPNFLVFVPVITSCADLGELAEGKKVHERIAEAGFETNDIIVTALLTMYAKCGDLQLARQFFDGIYSADVGAWNAMATSYAQFGHGSEVLELHKEMCLQGVQPNQITFLSVLVACNHMGMLEECQQQFECMISDHGITPVWEHYSCMTDLLGRSGKLEEAEKLISMMSSAERSRASSPIAVSAWMSFLGACKTHNDTSRASRAAEKLYELDPSDTAPYILLSQTVGT